MAADLTTILARVNIKFPTFKGLSTEDADDHVRRFLSLCRGRGLDREDAYLILFPSTLDNLADKWFSQFAQDHFLTWRAMQTAFCTTFRPSNYRERLLDQLENLELQKGETFAELMTRTTALVGKLPDPPGDFMVRKWVEKALPKQTQQKLRENLRPNSTLADFVATATQIEDARLLFTETTRDIPSASAHSDDPADPLASLRKELEALKLQRALKDELASLRQEKPSSEGALAKIHKELEELRVQQEAKQHLWCSICHSEGHTAPSCPQKSYCHFCEKSGHEDKDCYYLKGLRQIQQQLVQSPGGPSPTSQLAAPYSYQPPATVTYGYHPSPPPTP